MGKGTLIACRWAGAVMEKVTGVFGQVHASSELETPKNAKNVKWGWTDGRTDGQTKRGVESHSTRLK